MNLDFSDDQKFLQEEARKFLEKEEALNRNRAVLETDDKFDEDTTLSVDYAKLKNIKLIKPTIHKYLYGYTKSDFRRIDADEFTIAALLPVQRFKKATAKAVWQDSREMI